MKKIILALSATCVFSIVSVPVFSQPRLYAFQQKKEDKPGSQHKSLSVKNLLAGLETRYGVSFVYVEKLLADKQSAELAPSGNLAADLKQLLAPLGLGFKIISDKQVTIFEEEKKTPRQKRWKPACPKQN